MKSTVMFTAVDRQTEFRYHIYKTAFLAINKFDRFLELWRTYE